MKQIAIYDLDKTILTKPSFTPFLIYAAKHTGKALWWRAPLWLLALTGYKLKLYGRKPMKQFGLRLFVGRQIPADIAKKFADSVIPSKMQRGAAAAIARDRAAGKMLVIATAAPEFYATEIGALLQFDIVMATRHRQTDARAYLSQFDGENCYGPEKLKRVQEWLAGAGLKRNQCHICFYSDHPSDGPMLNWADDAILVAEGHKMQAIADENGWQMMRFAGQGDGMVKPS